MVGSPAIDTTEHETTTTTPRERVLDAAERCFMVRGYAATTLRDVAATVGIKHASLYHHVPGGKEQLFVEVVERNLDRHRRGLSSALQHTPRRLRDRLHAIAEWFLTQSPMDLVRMTQSDLPSLSPEAAGRLAQLTHESILIPVESVLRDAHEDGEIEDTEFGLVAGGIVGMVQSLFSVPDHVVQRSRVDMGKSLVDVVIDGIRACPPTSRAQ
ncbi:MAG: TetR/AcrR family transcriptional regulator [Spirochaetota bacterium]